MQDQPFWRLWVPAGQGLHEEGRLRRLLLLLLLARLRLVVLVSLAPDTLGPLLPPAAPAAAAWLFFLGLAATLGHGRLRVRDNLGGLLPRELLDEPRIQDILLRLPGREPAHINQL